MIKNANDKQWIKLLARAEAVHTELTKQARLRGIETRAYDFSKVEKSNAKNRVQILTDAAEALAKRLEAQGPRRSRN
jgi:hypothetical protein